MMRRCHLLEEIGEEHGIVWRASDEAASFIQLLETPYSLRLKSCAAWLAGQVRERTKAASRSLSGVGSGTGVKPSALMASADSGRFPLHLPETRIHGGSKSHL
jgi:hypothetical protein